MQNNLGSTLLEDLAMVNTEDGLNPTKREKKIYDRKEKWRKEGKWKRWQEGKGKGKSRGVVDI